MTDSEELAYWQKFLEGDLDSLSILFNQYTKGLISYGKKIYPGEELVNDSIQEVFIKLILKNHTLNPNRNIRYFVYRMLRNQIIDEIKQLKRTRKAENLIFNASGGSFEMDAENQLIDLENDSLRNTQLTNALSQLSTHQREAMHLKYTDGFTYEQIALVMGISITSVRTLIYRTLKQVKYQILGK